MDPASAADGAAPSSSQPLNKLDDIRDALRSFADERDWHQYHTPRNLLLALTGEVGELAEIFQWKGEVSAGLPELSAQERAHVAEEVSDVLLYLVRLADVCGIDMGAAVAAKLVKNAQKYPVQQSRGSSAKYTELRNSAAVRQAKGADVLEPPPSTAQCGDKLDTESSLAAWK